MIKRIINQQCIVVVNIFIAFASYAQPTYEWAGKYGGTANEYGNDITTDAAGNVYVTGYFEGTVDFDPGAGVSNLVSAGANDIFITKHDAGGNLIWAKRMGGAGQDYGYTISLDANGNVITAGNFTSTVDFDPGLAVSNLTNASGLGDAFISKLDNNGNFIWAVNFQSNASALNVAEDLNIDASGSIYISGRFLGAVDFDPGAGTSSLTSAVANYDVFVSKLDLSGNLVWVKQLGSAGADYSYGAALDVFGNFYLTVSYQGTIDTDPGAGTVNVTSSGAADSFILKLNPAGNFVWSKNIGGTGFDRIYDACVDLAGNVYVTGHFQSTVDFDPGAGTANLTSAGGYDGFVLKLDANGLYMWAGRIGGTATDYIAAIAVDQAGDACLTGFYQANADFDPGVGVTSLTAIGLDDAFITKLNTNGNFVWTMPLGGTIEESGMALTIDASNNILITGYFSSTVDFDPGAGTQNVASTGAGNYDIFIAKYSQCNTDNLAPIPVLAVLSDITSQCPVTSLTAPTATDNCAGTISGTHNVTLPITAQGTTVVTWTYDDGNGNSITQNQTIIIDDNTSPIANVVTLSDITSQCPVTSLTAPTATDNCAGTISGTHNATLPITTQGTTVVTWTYDDGNGNSITQNQTIVIDDNTSPIADVVTLSDITSQCSVTSLTPQTATDNCAGTISGTHNATLPITTQGTTTVTWTYDDGNGNTSTQTQDVVITDITAPVATIASLSNVTSECSVTSLTAPTATDNCAGSVTGTHNSSLPITTQGTTTVTWTYNDGNGNTLTQTQDIVITDITAPVATIASLPNVTSECSVTTLTAPTATDNCTGSITGTHNASLPITTQGTTIVTWTYDDGNGNTSTQTQDVVITPIDNGITQVDAVTLSADASGYDYQWIDCNNGNQAINSETNQTFTAIVNGSYAVEIDNGTCSVISNCLAINQVGIEDLFAELVKVYPNPTNGVITISGVELNTNIEIYNSIGELLKSQQSTSSDTIVTISEYSSGLYYVKLKGNSIEITRKIVKY